MSAAGWKLKLDRSAALALEAGAAINDQLTIVLSIADEALRAEAITLKTLAQLRRAAYLSAMHIAGLMEELRRTAVPVANSEAEKYALREYRGLTTFVGQDLPLAEPLVRRTLEWFGAKVKARDAEHGAILQEMLTRVAGCPRTPSTCAAEAPGDHTRWCMQCLLRCGLHVEYPGVERG